MKRYIDVELDYSADHTNYPLHAAVRSRNVDNVRKILQTNCGQVNQRDLTGCTPLTVAVAGGPNQLYQHLPAKIFKPNLQYFEGSEWWIKGVTIVGLLIESVADRDESGKTPLHMASRAESEEVVSLIVKAGADIHVRDRDGKIPLHLASENKWFGERIAISLLKCGSDPYQIDKRCWSSVECAVLSYHGRLDLINVYMKFGVDLSDSRFTFDGGLNLLHRLAQSNEFEDSEAYILRTKLLLTQGMSINKQTDLGLTPLHITMISQTAGNDKMVKSLCELGADPKIVDHTGRTVLHIFHFKSIMCCGDDLFDTEHMKETTCSKIQSTIQTLIAYGLDINAQDIFGATALHYALKGILKYEEYIKILLDNGADLLIKDHTGVCSLHLAASMIDTDSLDMITQYCTTVELNTTDSYGATVLHFTVVENDTEGTELFLKVGVDPHKRDSQGYTAYDLAVMMAHADIINIFETWASEKGVAMTSKLPLSQVKWMAVPPTFTPEEIETQTNLVGKVNQGILENLQLSCAEVLRSIEIGPATNNPDTSFIIDEMNKFISNLSKLCAQNDPIFAFRPELRGSVREGTKCGDPDEFEILCTLESFTGIGDVTLEGSPPGYAKLKLDSSNKNLFLQSKPWLMTKQGNLDMGLVAVEFYRIVKSVLNSARIWHDTPFVYHKDLELKSASCPFDLRWNGNLSKNLVISIDLVPGIKLPGYCPSLLTKDYPIPPHIEKYPCYLLCSYATDKRHTNNRQKYSYKLSYTALELAIMLDLPRHIRLGYILAKAIRSPHFCPRIVIQEKTYDPGVINAQLTAEEHFPAQSTSQTSSGEELDDVEQGQDTSEHLKASDVITSFMLKNALMWEIHKAGREHLESEPGSDICGAVLWAKKIYKHFYTAVNEDKMPYFFVQSMDLLDNSLKHLDTYREDTDGWNSTAMCKACALFLEEDFLEHKGDIVVEQNNVKTVQELNNPKLVDELNDPKLFLILINRLLGNID